MKKKILLLADDTETQLFVHRVLTEQGHQVDVADDLEAAQQLSRRTLYDLVVVDTCSTHFSSGEVSYRLRHNNPAGRPSVLVLGQLMMRQTQDLWFKIGADGCLCKPFSDRGLLLSVETVLRPSSKGLMEKIYREFA